MLTKLTFTKKTKVVRKLGTGEVKYTTQNIIGLPMVSEPILVMGIDPGKYFGMSLVGRGMGQVFSGVLDDVSMPLRDCAFLWAQDLCTLTQPDLVVIEGASYNERYGQVKLAEIRGGFALGASQLRIPVQIVAPKKPRKIVFGNGDIGAMNVWVGLNHNAADALCLALMPHYEGRRISDNIQGLVAKRHK